MIKAQPGGVASASFNPIVVAVVMQAGFAGQWFLRHDRSPVSELIQKE
jgi:hypothetical protein